MPWNIVEELCAGFCYTASFMGGGFARGDSAGRGGIHLWC